MEDARRLLRESRSILEAARADLDECHRLHEELLSDHERAAEQPQSFLEQPQSFQEPPEPIRLIMHAVDAEPEPVCAPTRPRVASEALHDAAAEQQEQIETLRDPEARGGGKAGEEVNGLGDTNGHGGGEEEEEDDDSDEECFTITPGLNIDGAEDQEPATETTETKAGPATGRSKPVFADDDDFVDDDLELLLPPKRLQQQMSMRTLRSPEEVIIGDGKADPSRVAGEDGEDGEDGIQEAQRVSLTMVNKQGYLTKLSSTPKAFARPHQRYFRLEGGILLYFVAHTSNSPKRMVQMLGARCEAYVRKSSKGTKKPVFEINVIPASDSRRRVRAPMLRMSTNSEEDARDWQGAILNNIACAAETYSASRRKEGRGRVEARRTSHLGADITEQPSQLPETLYDVLGVPADASERQIRDTYRVLARKFHPDKNPDIDTEAFAKIGQAYSILKDKTLRANYDLCETVKAAFRLGVLAVKHEEDGSTATMAFFLDRDFENLYWQEENKGSVLRSGYRRVELRFVMRIYAGEDDDTLELDAATRRRCLTLQLNKHSHDQGYADIVMELDTEEARNDMLDGLRILRCGASMLFQQNLDKMREDGLR